MICRDKIIFSCLIAAGLGAAGGYIFSSKFCAVTIVNRVGNAISSNQNLINQFNNLGVSSTNLLHSIFFNLPDAQAQVQNLDNSQNNIIEILRSFYGNTLANSLRPLFVRNKELLAQLATQARDKQLLTQTTQELRTNNDEIAKAVNDLNVQNPHVSLNEISFLLTQQAIALQNNSWDKAIDYAHQTKNSYEKTAEQINDAIAQQFPQKM